MPFHCVMSVLRALVPLDQVPTATQLVALAHETELSWLNVQPAGFETGTTAHAVPFQRSDTLAPGACCHTPTAMQNDVLRHETAFNAVLYRPLTFGLATTTHPVPFQRSVKV